MSEKPDKDQAMIEDTGPNMRVLPQQHGFRLFARLLVFHLALAMVMVIIVNYFPNFLEQLPIGGVGSLVKSGDVTVSTMIEGQGEADSYEVVDSLLETTNELDRLGYARKLIFVLIGVWLLMLPVFWVHRGIHQGSTHDHSLDETILILPGVVASIVLVVQHSLALAFSLAGIVAGVQFRRALQDTFDALFILVAIGVGIAAGVEALEIATVLSVFFAYAALYVSFFGDGLETHHIMRRKLEKKQRKAMEADQSDE